MTGLPDKNELTRTKKDLRRWALALKSENNGLGDSLLIYANAWEAEVLSALSTVAPKFCSECGDDAEKPLGHGCANPACPVLARSSAIGATEREEKMRDFILGMADGLLTCQSALSPESAAMMRAAGLRIYKFIAALSPVVRSDGKG